jgi:imidazolonepropionase-like amidohydrolase
MVTPGEVLVEGDRIAEVGSGVKRPAGAEVIDLGDRTLLPGLIDAQVHLFLHPRNEIVQTYTESVPQRTISPILAARDDLMAGFTAERDMGTRAPARPAQQCAMRLITGRFPDHACVSAATPSTF